MAEPTSGPPPIPPKHHLAAAVDWHRVPLGADVIVHCRAMNFDDFSEDMIIALAWLSLTQVLERKGYPVEKMLLERPPTI
jgi:hypothetical protein